MKDGRSLASSTQHSSLSTCTSRSLRSLRRRRGLDRLLLRAHLVADRLLRSAAAVRRCRRPSRSSPSPLLEKWSAFTVSFLVSSPSPRMRTPSKVPTTSRFASARPCRPCCRRRSASQIADVDDGERLLPGGVAEAALGKRRNSGIWPPSNSPLGSRAPALAYWPLWPRPAVLPCPEPMPRPTRRFSFRLCDAGGNAGEVHEICLVVSADRSSVSSLTVRRPRTAYYFRSPRRGAGPLLPWSAAAAGRRSSP